MRQHQILLMDWGISKEKIETILSNELGIKIFSFKDSLRSQFQTKDDLTKKILGFINKGLLVPNELITLVIKRSLKSSNDDLLISDFPRTREQLLELYKISNQEDFEIRKIWYFKHADQKQFLQKYFASEDGKNLLKRFGKGIIEKWKSTFQEKQRYISEMQSESNSNVWNIIQDNFELDLYEEKIKRKIKACA